MKVFIMLTEQNEPIEGNGLKKITEWRNGLNFYANMPEADCSVQLNQNESVYLFGEVFYHTKTSGDIKIVDSKSHSYLKKIFSENSLEDCISNLEGQYLGIYVNTEKRIVKIFSDRYARLDYFYALKGADFYMGSDLDFIFKHINPVHDPKMLAHLFCVYGWYVPKGCTIYKNVKRLRVGEILTISESGIQNATIPFKSLQVKDYNDIDLERYYKILRESVIARANKNGTTWVASSSGWDSSMLLGMLVNEFGSKNINMLTGSMQYSDETDVINKFEIDKIKKIGKYYNIKPEITSLDLKSKTAPDYLQKIMPYYKSKHMYSYIAFNYSKLSDRLNKIAGPGQTIFNGETSDSFHNFGFSQFATFFHTKKSFTEYGDKMNCYLYGPSFFKKALEGTCEKDKVFQIFKKMMPGVDFASSFSNKNDMIESYLFPLFYGSPRVPFAKNYLNSALTNKGQQEIYRFPFREYMPEVLSVSEKDIYSWLIYLYHSFHAQGSTVGMQKYSMEYNKHYWRSPFNDSRMIEFLSQAPEKWGRGLELNNTKYPLKWVARNKIKFPYELLEEGPHSYLYDVIEGFTIYAEITYRSGATDFFKESLRNKSYREILDSTYFNIAYLDNLVDGFLKGKEMKGQDFNNLVSLITLSITGWY